MMVVSTLTIAQTILVVLIHAHILVEVLFQFNHSEVSIG